MKFITLLLLTLITLQAQNFNKRTILGSWELSSAKLNKTVSFGKYIGKQRNETLKLLFNTRGQMKVAETGDVYNYEILQGQLKIYETKVYGNDYRVKNKNRYDLLKIVGNFEGCPVVKIVKKKIPGYKSRHDLKMCKVSNYPQPTYQESVSKYNTSPAL